MMEYPVSYTHLEEAKQAVAEAKSAGVRTIMITGDHVITASAIEIGRAHV